MSAEPRVSPIDNVLGRLKGVKERGNGFMALCPAHEDQNPSLSINVKDGIVLMKCFARCENRKVLEAIGLEPRDLFPETSRRNPVVTPIRPGAKSQPKATIIATYDFVKDGVLCFQEVRYDPKAFRQRRPDGRGGWIWNMHDVDRFLYHHDDVVASGDPVCVVEGPKDTETLRRLGFNATTAPGGAGKGKWLQSYTDTLAGRFVIVLGDNDEPGRAYAQDVATQLHAAGCTVKVPDLSDNWPEMPEKGDVTDWVDAGNDPDDLEKIIAETPVWEPEDTSPTDTPRPMIDAGDQDLARVSAQAWHILGIANMPARLFRFGGSPVRVEGNEDDATPVPQTLTEDRLSHELARAGKWYKVTQKGEEKAAAPPMRVIKDMLAAPSYPLPSLLGIVQSPVFAPDGSLQMEPGYHPDGRTFYAPAPGFHVPAVSESPTDEDVHKARSLIVEDLLGDFPFASEAERANAIALFLDPYVRNMIDGPTPLRMIEAPTPGSGKGLLAEAILRTAIGDRFELTPAPHDDDEWRKQISTKLVKAPTAIVIDNLTTALDSGTLAAALTSTWWSSRRLGVNEDISVPSRSLWIVTANNPTMSTEIARRTVRIRLDPKVDRPWQRSGFRHEDLRGWVRSHRKDLVWAALTLIQSWIVAGQPRGTQRLGSYEDWSTLHAGLLAQIGIEGFLANADEFFETADLEGAVWRQLVSLWFEQFGEKEVGVADLFGIALNVDGLDLGKGSERSQRITFGRQLGQHRDRVIGDCRIVQTRAVKRVQQWRLIKSRPGGNPFDVFHTNGQSDTSGSDKWTS